MGTIPITQARARRHIYRARAQAHPEAYPVGVAVDNRGVRFVRGTPGARRGLQLDVRAPVS